VEDNVKVAPLKRVTALIETAVSDGDPFSACAEVAFIFGIGSAGVVPFECLLAGKQEGDGIVFHVGRADAEDFFGHLTASFIDLFGQRNDVFVRTRVLRIETPAPREVVKAIAEMTARGHGRGCECGCGCG
jgi:hypothetical protein